MALADIYGEIRSCAREDAESTTDRAALEAGLVAQFTDRLRDLGLLEAAAVAWLTKVVHDIVAEMIKPAGASPRAAAGQMVAWQEMQPRPGWHALRVYRRQMTGVYLRFQLVTRILASLDVAFGEDPGSIDAFPTFADACRAAGVDERDVEALAS